MVDVEVKEVVADVGDAVLEPLDIHLALVDVQVVRHHVVQTWLLLPVEVL